MKDDLSHVKEAIMRYMKPRGVVKPTEMYRAVERKREGDVPPIYESDIRIAMWLLYGDGCGPLVVTNQWNITTSEYAKANDICRGDSAVTATCKDV